MVERLSAWILRRRELILTVLALLSLGFAAGALRLKIATDFEAFFLPHDPDLKSYQRLKKSFGSDEFILIAYEATEGVFSPEALGEIRAITHAIEGAERVGSVISLTNAKEFRTSESGLPIGVPIVPNADLSKLLIYGIQAKIQANPFYRDFLLSPDAKTSFLLVQMSNPENQNFVRVEMTRTIETLLAPFDHGNLHIAGTPIYLTALYRLILDNLLWLGGLAFVIVLGLLWLTLRTLRGVLLPVTVLALSVLWNLGIFGLAGAPITIASSVVVPLIVAISVTSSIHLLLAYTTFLEEKGNERRALERAMHHIMAPAFYSAFTTALGFLTLATAQVLPVVQTGLYTAAGVMASFVLTITVVPIALSYHPAAPVRGRGKRKNAESPTLLARFLDGIAAFNLRHSAWLIAAWALLTGIAGWGILSIRIETNPLTFFREGSPMAQTHAYFEKHLGGTLPFDVVVQGKKDDFKRLDAYPNLRKLQRFLEGQPELHGVVGTPDLLAEVNAALNGGKRALPYEPQSFQQQTRLVDLARNYYPFVDRFVDRQWSQARFTSRIQAMNSDDLAWLIRKIDTYAREDLDPRYEYRVTGIVKLLANMIDKVRQSQINSLGLALVLLWICFSVFLRSPVLGTLAMVPNVVPIVLTLGLMGTLGIDLDLATVMMPSIAIGLAVDDTLHFFSAFRRRVMEGATGEEAIGWTLHFRGRAFLYTSLVLVAGFGILLFSTLRPVADFGVISCAAIVSALLADLLLNPALLRLARPRLASWETST